MTRMTTRRTQIKTKGRIFYSVFVLKEKTPADILVFFFSTADFS